MSRSSSLRRSLLPVALLVPVVVLLAACGGGGKAAAPTTTRAPRTATTSTTSAPATQHMTITPSSGLTSGETVHVRASGFSPNESLGITECANKGAATGPGDCNLADLKSVTSDKAGDVVATYTVTKGPFGSAHTVCRTATSCVLTVTQETPSPTQDATVLLKFS